VGYLTWVLALLLRLDSPDTLDTTGVAQGFGSVRTLTPLRCASRAALHAGLDLARAWLCLLLVLLGLATAPDPWPKGEGRIARMLFKVTVAPLHG